MRKQKKTGSSREISSRLCALAKYRAKKQGITFDLTPADIHVPELCLVLGVWLARNIGGRAQGRYSPTLDRLDPKKGYVKGNVVVISSRANELKGRGTPDELERVASFSRQHTA